MVAGLNKIDDRYLYQLLEQMGREGVDTLTISRDDVLKEIGSRSFSEHMGTTKLHKQSLEFEPKNFKCTFCEFASASEVGVKMHETKIHLKGAKESTIDEFKT